MTLSARYWASRMSGLPAPDVLAAEIMEDPRAALEQFGEIAEELKAA